MSAPAVVPPDSHGLKQAADALRAGLLVAFPTDTFFALGADALDPSAVARVFAAKGRAEASPLPVLVADVSGVEALAAEFPRTARQLADRFWPGPLTLVLPAKPGVPAAVTGGTGRVGIRVPGHAVARRLIQMAGIPVTGTSANRTGQPPCKDLGAVLSQLGKSLDYAVNGDCGKHGSASTVVDFTGQDTVVLREGAISAEMVRQAETTVGR